MADICHECENPAWTGRTIEAPALPSGGEGGTSNFNALDNRPKYDGVRMTGNTDIPNVSRDIERLDGDVEDIQELIPEAATPENQLADKDFVNSSVATNTANFVGTYNSLEELEAVENPSNNDYGFVISTDEQGNTVFNRYKYVSSVENWEFEYALNNSSFTAVQWAAINSGITEGNVEKINAILEIKSIGNGLVLENNGQLRQKLYTETGNNTDAAMDQKTTTEAIGAIYGRARVLTEADYNYPADNPTRVALWLLEPGIYTWERSFAYNVYANMNTRMINRAAAFVKRDGTSDGYYTITVFGSNATGSGGNQLIWNYTTNSEGFSTGTPHSLSYDINDTLTSTRDYESLSANQGRVLNEKIGDDLSNLTTTDKTSLINAINEVAGKTGKAKILTSADYNYPVNNPTRIVLSMLEPGLYQFGEDHLNWYPYQSGDSSGGSIYQTFFIQEYTDRAAGQYYKLIFIPTLIGLDYTIVGTSWEVVPRTTLMPATNNLTSTSATTPLSANQGRVLKGLIDGKQDKLTAGDGIEIDSENVISIATISAEDWSALWQ